MYTILIILALIIGLLLLTGYIGRRLPKKHTAKSRIRLHAPAEQVWQVISDFESHPEWRPGLSRVERHEDVNGKPCWVEISAKFGHIAFTVVESDRPRLLVTRVHDERLPFGSSWTYELEAEDGTTILTITEYDTIDNPVLRFISKFVLSYYGAMDVYMVALAKRLHDSTQPEHLLAIEQQEPDG